MKKTDALKLGYCKYCAAYGLKGWNCGVTLDVKTDDCILPPDVQERFKGERGLEGETQRHVKPVFGDELPKRTRRRKRKFK